MEGRSLAALTRFSKNSLLAISVLITFTLSSPVYSEEEGISGISDLAKQGLKLMQQATGMEDDLDTLVKDSQESVTNAGSIFPELQEISDGQADAVTNGMSELPVNIAKQAAPDWLKKQIADQDAIKNEPILYLFATRGMSELELAEMFRETTGRDKDNLRVVVVFRGIYPDETIPKAVSDIRRIASKAKLDYEPNIIFDPTLFKKFGISEAPEMVYARGDHDLIRASGTFSVDWLMNEYQRNGRTGDIGSYGSVNVVNEPDLIDLMKERFSKIDLESRKQKIINNYWMDKEFIEISEAKTAGRYKLEPTVVVSKDIITPDGTVIAKRGDKINPLYKMPFTTKIIFFNAQDEDHVLFVEEKLKTLNRHNYQIQLITTAIVREKGWKHLRELDERLGHPVYLLTPEIQQRFGINRIPALLEADDRYFYVENFVIETRNHGPRKIEPQFQLEAEPVKRDALHHLFDGKG